MTDVPADETRIPSAQSALVEAIKDHVRHSPLNRLRDIDGSPIWDEPCEFRLPSRGLSRSKG